MVVIDLKMHGSTATDIDTVQYSIVSSFSPSSCTWLTLHFTQCYTTTHNPILIYAPPGWTCEILCNFPPIWPYYNLPFSALLLIVYPHFSWSNFPSLCAHSPKTQELTHYHIHPLLSIPLSVCGWAAAELTHFWVTYDLMAAREGCGTLALLIA